MRESFSIDHDKYLQEWYLNNMVIQKMKTHEMRRIFDEQDDMKIIREKTDELNKNNERP